ncbi:hypothetical protein NE865_03103 [Phthorimaea operculella]|nr:hypothetical protein NE865_03103 [Phthorimaea operculella]
MKGLNIVILCLGALSIVSATPAPEARESSPQHSDYEYNYDSEAQQSQAQEPQESASHYDAYIQDVQAAATGGGGGKKGYSSGSGLRTIAVGSANQAKTALGNQAAAAYQAAYVAKNTLAQSAAQASATAQAALAGKQVILSGLEQQVRDAKVALQGEEMQLQQAKRSAQAAAQAAQQAMHQVNVIQAALNAAQATSSCTECALTSRPRRLLPGRLRYEHGIFTDYQCSAMVGAARQRLHTLQEQLHGVRIDFEATQAAARKAQVCEHDFTLLSMFGDGGSGAPAAAHAAGAAARSAH